MDDLNAAGERARGREGRHNVYQVDRERPMPDPVLRGKAVGELLRLAEETGGTEHAE